MPGLDTEQVRSVASRQGYKEISHNEDSRVISFRGGPSSSTRINVYYTTGTVGTCLNHPIKGKTQLFRRNVDASQLEQIFQNPRTHTGTGYYRKNSTQRWKSREGDTDVFETDSARRWRFVAAASGLSTSETEIDAIAKFCSSWDALYWEPGVPPKMSTTRFSCGSRAALLQMLRQVGNELDGEIYCCKFKDLKKYESNEISRGDVAVLSSFGEDCCNISSFLDKHAGDVKRLKRQLSSFRRDVRIELMQWFVGRDQCGYCLVDGDFNELASQYSDRILSAHYDYAELMYTKKAHVCPLHGVYFD